MLQRYSIGVAVDIAESYGIVVGMEEVDTEVVVRDVNVDNGAV